MKIIQLIRRHASALALLAICAGMIAAPYLIPENPDSEVFRTGTLGLILLAACYIPLQQAFSRANQRTLIAGLFWGFMFACALGLGSELLVYDGLLRGMGSMLRRAAVPVLATPLIGGLAARMMIIKPIHTYKFRISLPLWMYALIFNLCWLPLLLAYFPGMLNYDFLTEFAQHLNSSYNSAHPLAHSVLINNIVALGEAIHSRTFGVLLYTLLQMIVFSFALGNSCVFLQRHKVPTPFLLLTTILYALHPIFSVMALSLTKDTFFASALLTIALLTWELIESPNTFFSDKRSCTMYIFCAINTILMRNNGIFAFALLLPALIITLRYFRLKAICLSTVCLVSSATCLFVLNIAYQPQELPSFHLYSLPAQQLVRAYNSTTMSEADKAELASWYFDPLGLKVAPHCADNAKVYINRGWIQSDGNRFMSMWAKHAGTHMHEYVEAFLMLNVGSWYPDDLSHSTIYPDFSWNDKGYLQTQEYDMTEQGINTYCLLPKVRDFYELICRRNRYQKYPLVSVLFCTATPFWILLFSGALLIAKRQSRYAPVLLGFIGIWFSYLLGPCTLPRYTLPLFCIAPPILFTAFDLPYPSNEE